MSEPTGNPLTEQEREQLAYLERIAASEDAALFRRLVADLRASNRSVGASTDEPVPSSASKHGDAPS